MKLRRDVVDKEQHGQRLHNLGRGTNVGAARLMRWQLSEQTVNRASVRNGARVVQPSKSTGTHACKYSAARPPSTGSDLTIVVLDSPHLAAGRMPTRPAGSTAAVLQR
jgi:hypothetical protein